MSSFFRDKILEELIRRNAELVKVYAEGEKVVLYGALYEEEVLGIFWTRKEAERAIDDDNERYPLRRQHAEHRVVPFEIGQELPFEES